MLLTKEVSIKIFPRNIGLYKKYNCRLGDNIKVKILDLSKFSRKKVKVKCDVCGIIKEIKYCDYLKVFNKKNKYYCYNCKGISIKKSVNNKYGVDNVFQIENVKNRIKKTIKEKYGVNHHLQNTDILEKLKITNQERYGVSFIPELKRYDTESIVEKFKKIHNNRYDYRLVNYTRIMDNIDIICKKHGKFTQLAESHLRGMGCPKCKTSKGEIFIMDYLDNINIQYVYQKKFERCIYKSKLPFDFYIPSINLIVEYDGYQHFYPIEKWGGDEEFKLRQLKDEIKNNYCIKNKIRIERISFEEDIKKRLEFIIEKYSIRF